MTEKIIEESFEKAGEVGGGDTLNSRAVYLSEYLTEDHKYSITAKSLIRYFKKENKPKLEVLDGLAAFLGLEDFEHYVQSRTPTKPIEGERLGWYKGKRLRGKEFWLLLGFFLLALGAPAYQMLVKEESTCIEWMGMEYQAVSCSGEKLQKGFNQDLLENFKRIEVNADTEFFRHGQPQVWYYKNGEELEFYTAPGLHPENGRTLKPITKYMINKYVKGKKE